MSWSSTLVAASLVVTGSFGGYWAGLASGKQAPVALSASAVPSREPKPTAHANVTEALMRCPATLDLSELEALVRRVVKEEIKPVLDARPSGDSAELENAEPTPEALAAHERAMQIVRAGVAARRWRAEDRDALDPLLPTLTPAHRTEVLTTLLPAINSGNVQVDANLVGPIL